MPIVNAAHDRKVLSGSKPAMTFYIDSPGWLRIEAATGDGKEAVVYLQKAHFQLVADILKKFAVADVPRNIVV